LIRQKMEEFIQDMYVALRQFPKSERHVLSQEIRKSLWAMLRFTTTAHRRYQKKSALEKLDIELDLLRSQVRLAYNLRFLPMKKYETLSRGLNELGRMVGGWIKTATQSPQNKG